MPGPYTAEVMVLIKDDDLLKNVEDVMVESTYLRMTSGELLVSV